LNRHGQEVWNEAGCNGLISVQVRSGQVLKGGLGLGWSRMGMRVGPRPRPELRLGDEGQNWGQVSTVGQG
jgi:hypothetical protein